MQRKPASRLRFTPEQRAALLTAYRQGDLTQREFALRNKLSVSCLGLWLRKSKSGRVGEVPPSFIRLPGGLPLAGVSQIAYKILFAGGHGLEVPVGFQAGELAELCRILRDL